MAEESSSTEGLRQNLRDYGRDIRRIKRETLFDKHRGSELAQELGEEVSAETVRELALLLRKRGATEVSLLAKLQRGLLQGPDRVSAFLATDGALTALIKALTGLNPDLELKAAYCICNLARTGGRGSAKICKSAAPYLMVHLEGMNPLMQDASAWTLGNLSAGGRHSWSLLHAQGLLPKLLHLLQSPHKDVLTATVYALTHFLAAGLDSLEASELKSVACRVAPLLHTRQDTARLLFLLSSTSVCDEELCAAQVPERALVRLAELLGASDLSQQTLMCEVTFLVRTIANLSAESSIAAHSVINSLMASPTIVLQTLLSKVFPHLYQETLWLLANLFKHNNEDIRNLAMQLIPILSVSSLK